MGQSIPAVTQMTSIALPDTGAVLDRHGHWAEHFSHIQKSTGTHLPVPCVCGYGDNQTARKRQVGAILLRVVVSVSSLDVSVSRRSRDVPMLMLMLINSIYPRANLVTKVTTAAP